MKAAANSNHYVEPGTNPVAGLRTRAHLLSAPSTPLARAGLWLQTRLEDAVVSASQLPDATVYRQQDFPWAAEIVGQWRKIRAELDAVMVYRDQMPSFHEIIKEVGTITNDDQWKTFFLINARQISEGNAARCPETMRLLSLIPDVSTAFFSILGPGKHIPAHRGAYNGVLRFHLGLQVPEPAEKCRIRIGDEFHCWREGQALIFDDSFNHEIWNDTNGYRAVLFVDFPRPLRQPWHTLNRAFLGLAPLVPFLREADARQQAWEKDFYRGDKAAGR
jgi:aspartyl/asparaginyl beta-hydroxylase (cupin superfamily)